VFYGAAEFSRDIDFAILADAANLTRLRQALNDLRAENIAVPSFSLKHLRRGHAVHFRCQHPEAPRMRIDLMSKMRGVDAFPALWRRRTVIALPDGTPCALLSPLDLVQAKKTQRDKDWPMIRRLVEAHYFEHRTEANSSRVRFWLQELRTPQLLAELTRAHPQTARRLAASRPLLRIALAGSTDEIQSALTAEETAERQRDAHYWLPLRRELEAFRHSR
jgi:hypothetical protein